jgi:hypothetical protein
MKKLIAAVAVAVVASVGVIGVATAGHTVTADSHVTITNGWDPRNKPSCPSGTVNGGRIESIANGVFGKIEIYGFDGEKFNWRILEAYDGDGVADDPNPATHIDMAVVLVKGGPTDLEQYNYDYAGGGLDDYDEGLTGPPNAKSGKYYGASNALFCFDPKGGGNN